jgi:hypothetical protein
LAKRFDPVDEEAGLKDTDFGRSPKREGPLVLGLSPTAEETKFGVTPELNVAGSVKGEGAGEAVGRFKVAIVEEGAENVDGVVAGVGAELSDGGTNVGGVHVDEERVVFAASAGFGGSSFF